MHGFGFHARMWALGAHGTAESSVLLQMCSESACGSRTPCAGVTKVTLSRIGPIGHGEPRSRRPLRCSGRAHPSRQAQPRTALCVLSAMRITSGCSRMTTGAGFGSGCCAPRHRRTVPSNEPAVAATCRGMAPGRPAFAPQRHWRSRGPATPVAGPRQEQRHGHGPASSRRVQAGLRDRVCSAAAVP